MIRAEARGPREPKDAENRPPRRPMEGPDFDSPAQSDPSHEIAPSDFGGGAGAARSRPGRARHGKDEPLTR